MDGALLNGAPYEPNLWGEGNASNSTPMSSDDAATKGVAVCAAANSCHSGGKDYPMFADGLAVFAQDGPGSQLADAIQLMRFEGVFRAWAGGKAALSNKEIADKTVAEVAAAPRLGPLLVLAEWDTLTEDERRGPSVASRATSPEQSDAAGYGPDTYRFELAHPGTVAPYLVALRWPTTAEMAVTPDTWYADREKERRLAARIDPSGPRDGVTVYTEPGCRGNNWHFLGGNYDIDALKATIGNDTIASISVGYKDQVTLYPDAGFHGTPKTFQGSTRILHSVTYDLPPGLLREVSSMKVTEYRIPEDPALAHWIRPGQKAGASTGYTLLDDGRYR
ncbi:hypothetical protein [Streptomyces sp. NPDC059597]|uniref:hypothetical protein n=1 Tax=Streptomyces sp. NPDC059597 TaxID=3346879 RepID=UPI0036920858